MTADRQLNELDSKLASSKFVAFLNIPAVWTFSFMNRPMWGTLLSIGEDGTLEIIGKRDRIVLARPDSVIGAGMV